MIEPRRVWTLICILTAAACDDAPGHKRALDAETSLAPGDDAGEDEPEEPWDAAEDLEQDASLEDAESLEQDAAEADAALPVKNDSFETALPIDVDGSGLLTDERAADQVDYFVFSGKAGTFYELTTNRGTFSPDNFISLYDADQQLIAENDVGWIWPGDAIDSRLIVRLPATGDYYVRVEDRFTPPEFFLESGGLSSLLYYVLRVRAISSESEGYAFADQASSGVRLRKHEASGYEYLTLLGQFNAEGDVLAFAGLPDDLLVGHIHPGGPSGSGSTAHGGRVRVLDGDHVLAEIDRAKGQEHIHPPVSEGGHQLAISAEGPLGDNPFYALDLVLMPDNPREQAEATNSTPAGAELITFMGRGRRRGQFLVSLGQADVDYYRFDALAGQQVAVGCEGESAGSGVRGLRVELRDAAEQVLASAGESATDNLKLPVVSLNAAGAYYLRLSSEPSASQIEPWTRCSIVTN